MTHEHSAAHRAFIGQLNELREQASSPSLSELEKLSRHPLPDGVRARRLLASSTTQEILKGKRVGVPSWAWVISFVETCHEAARQVRLDLGPVQVAEWKARWQRARNSGPACSEAVGPVSAPVPEVSTVDRLTATETIRCYLDHHGRVAAHLAQLALGGDGEACFHLALLTVLRGWGHDSREWLCRAVAAGHAEAAALRDSPDLRTEAAALAYRHGCLLEADGSAKSSVARFFFRLAAETGHPDAIAKLSGASVRGRARPVPLSAPITEPVQWSESDEAILDQLRDQFSDQWARAAVMLEPGPDQWIGAGEP
ncbi:hypothetical protein ACIBG8_01620 [Nonomuraea sp. NPDC050556]|uniref:hypothetical protein n=1 Tax=Nonomuraea sp. NPDC050556 TaxID=3364369 RepID=UPI0037BCD2FE